MSKYFGTDGFRGEANVTLTVDHAFRVGRFLGWYYSQDHQAQIVIGKDTRRSSYMFECALAAGITASGADACLMHVTTTPSVSYISKVDEFDCGIMISASHNPFHDNGIKLINRHGEKMEQEVIDQIEAYLDSARELPYATGEHIGRVIDYASGRNRYIGYLISLATHSYKDMKVALDCANGSAWMIAKNVFEALGAETYVLSNTPNGLNINDGCGSTHIEQLQQYVKENHMDIGFAFDGDADRCLAVDEKGNLVDGDGILYIYGSYMKEREKLANNTIVTAIKLMQAMLSKKMPLSKLTQDLKIYPLVLKNVRVQDKERALNDFAVQNAVREVSAKLGDQGRILLRKSGTEPVLRVMVEAPTNELCEENVDAVIAVMRQRGLIVEAKK